VAVDYVVQISAATVTEFYIVFVENFVEFVISGYFFLQGFKKLLCQVTCYTFGEWGVILCDISSSSSLWSASSEYRLES